ncbi:amplified in breast cancer 2-related [Anaeramoeba ignava]|uniref:Nonsense-mediated mRNA decay factor SMG8 n=1 Tax=Anaeramoeba ignava TaxID=1746090 RepID=A0A9Q0RGD7_ANAIG|nr:amplified in breast cancer 2-related [Anaeramoeba ignava]
MQNFSFNNLINQINQLNQLISIQKNDPKIAIIGIIGKTQDPEQNYQLFDYLTDDFNAKVISKTDFGTEKNIELGKICPGFRISYSEKKEKLFIQMDSIENDQNISKFLNSLEYKDSEEIAYLIKQAQIYYYLALIFMFSTCQIILINIPALRFDIEWINILKFLSITIQNLKNFRKENEENSLKLIGNILPLISFVYSNTIIDSSRASISSLNSQIRSILSKLNFIKSKNSKNEEIIANIDDNSCLLINQIEASPVSFVLEEINNIEKFIQFNPNEKKEEQIWKRESKVHLLIENQFKFFTSSKLQNFSEWIQFSLAIINCFKNLNLNSIQKLLFNYSQEIEEEKTKNLFENVFDLFQKEFFKEKDDPNKIIEDLIEKYFKKENQNLIGKYIKNFKDKCEEFIKENTENFDDKSWGSDSD